MAYRIHPAIVLLASFTLACSKGSGPQMQAEGSSGQSEAEAAAMSTGMPTSTGQVTTSTTTSGASTSPVSEGSTADSSSSSSGGADTFTFLGPLDVGPIECDPWQQDCPPTEKCAWYSSDGTYNWDRTKCVPIVADPVPVGAECVGGNGISGLDNCGLGSMCWDVNAEGIGYCVPLCGGSIDDRQCPQKFYCWSYSLGLSLCFELCHPLLQDCDAPTGVCHPFNADYAFTCKPDTSGDGGQAHDACEYGTCEPGNLCVEPSSAVECDAEDVGCCEPFCDTKLPNTCPGQGQECIPYFQADPIPPEYANVGYCSVPG